MKNVNQTQITKAKNCSIIQQATKIRRKCPHFTLGMAIDLALNKLDRQE